MIPLKDQTVIEKSTVEFECTLTAPARPDHIEWFIDGKKVDLDSPRFETVVDGNTVKLVIHTVETVDAGDVTVRIKDKESTAKLKVEGD